VLFVRGTIEAVDEWSVAVVRTRRMSQYGWQVGEELCRGLASNGITIVSGLALGMDGQAHTTALECGGRTIAMQGCGTDIVYPAKHAGLVRRIARAGAVVSEQPLGTSPKADYFLAPESDHSGPEPGHADRGSRGEAGRATHGESRQLAEPGEFRGTGTGHLTD
jgi:predicted Rossmann fold nucleotide-binding protein DprA/Smf involved in DNA uptake